MSYDVRNIINITTEISPAGLGFANFASATLFAPEADTSVLKDTYKDYTSITDLEVDFASTTETFKAASKWLGAIPTPITLRVWVVDATDATWTATLDKARLEFWWYWSFFTAAVYADLTPTTGDVEVIASWHNDNKSYFINCQTGVSATAIRDPGTTTDIATVLSTLGYRYVSTFAHATDAYAGISLAPWYAVVNYQAANTTITGEYKKLSGIAAENLTATANNAMTSDAKKAIFYSQIDLQGSLDDGRVINSKSHSSFGEWVDDVVNLDAFVNNLSVELFNVLANQVTKLGQDPVGESVLLNTAKAVCEQYISNGYLGPRDYLDPDDGVDKFTRGYEILTKPEDILDLSPTQRADRKSAPIRIRIFKKGAIHFVDVNVIVF